jgi:pimeloyl-ACP methyl ester carboxylesterase
MRAGPSDGNPSRMRPFGRLATLAVIVASTASALFTAPASAAAPAPLAWGACPDGGGSVGIECSTVEVPVDWSRPGGRKLTLTVGRLRSDGERPAKGSVLVNFGGPIGNSVELMRMFGGAFAQLRHSMHIVTWDIRGGPGLPGYSTRLPCTWRSLPVPTFPKSQREFDALAAKNRAFASGCRDKDPELFDRMDSATNARDADAIRAALGERQVNFYGSSYGGFFAQAYARLFPHRVRTMVLDGTINHSASNWARELAASARDNERVVRRFVAWCDAEPSCALHGRDVARVWRSVVASANDAPMPTSTPGVSYVGEQLQIFGMFMARAGLAEWPALARALAGGERGDASGYVPPPPNLPYPSAPQPGVVECPDLPRPHSYAELRASVRRLNAIAPLTGASGTLLRAVMTCVGWPTPVTNPPRDLPRGLPPLVMAGAWVEYDSALRAIRQVPGSRAIEHDGPGHTLYLPNECARAHLDRYLSDRVLPPRGTRC